jgi:prepilin-type processing-associated H-X9-DG protein
MSGHNPTLPAAENYRQFAVEAHGRSPAYEALSLAVAGDAGILAFLATLPPAKRQPNLLFAAARYLLGGAPGITSLRALAGERQAELSGLMMERRTQTNEPARCATLLPVLARLPQPLALIEVGASAGLTLLIDKYSYDYDGHRVAGLDPGAPTLRCATSGPVPLPGSVPEVAWRAGLDLNPLDVTDADAVRWLSCLVWPGEGDREQRLAAAIATARRDPPPVHRGDLLADLPALARQAPAGATLVVYHSAVLAYVAPHQRRLFADAVRGLPAVWLSSEGPSVLPDISLPAHDGAPLVLVRDGRTPVAFADGHGSWLRWLPTAP